MCPLSCNLNLLFEDLISSSLTTKPPIEADTNLANPKALIDAEAFVSVAGAPAITAGVLMLSTLKSPLTTKLDPSYCTYCDAALLPNKNPPEAVIVPSAFNIKF